MLRLLIGTAATGAFLAASLGQATFSRAAGPAVAALSEPEVAARVAPSVVQVLPEDESRDGQASGVKIAEGILTNDHVVGDAERVRVVAADGRRGTAAVLSRAPALDLVLLQADLDLPAVELEGVAEQRQGETVLLLGYPQPDAVGPGEALTLTRGLVSAIRRDHEGVAYIQTDAAVDPGHSGGAMVNLRGKLVGIPTFGVRGSRSLNFAVGADAVRALLRMPPPGPAPAGPAYRADPAAVLLTPDDLGPEWRDLGGPPGAGDGADEGVEAARPSAAGDFVRPDPGGPGRGDTTLLSAVWVRDDAQRAHLLWERAVRHAPGHLARLPDPTAAEACRAYARAKGDVGELHALCRAGNVVMAVTMRGARDVASHEALVSSIGRMAERVRDGST
jgi:hypothetical protein